MNKHFAFILYDQHISHINVALFRWAKERNIILIVLPAHTSHVLKPMDFGSFGPFRKFFNDMRHRYMPENTTTGVNRCSVCSLGLKAYLTALSSFRKCGIHTFNRDVLKTQMYNPAKIFVETAETTVDYQAEHVEKDYISTEVFFEEINRSTFRKKRQQKRREIVLLAGR